MTDTLPTIIPTLETERLILRPFTPADAPTVRELAGLPEVAATTLNIPHPYPAGLAEQWIGRHAEGAANGEIYTFAIARRADGQLLGGIGIGGGGAHKRAEIGYWLGVRYWNRGYTSEAARRVVAFGFEQLGLNRIQSTHFPRNPASGRVMQKAGMTYEGVQRGYLLKGDTFEDVAMYAILRADWERPPRPPNFGGRHAS
jgi:RimJ/RimL family protein N-acetyltransferase